MNIKKKISRWWFMLKFDLRMRIIEFLTKEINKDDVPNDVSMQAIHDADAGIGITTVHGVDELMKAMEDYKMNNYIFLVQEFEYESTETLLVTTNLQKAIDLTFQKNVSTVIWFNEECWFSIDGDYSNKGYLNLELDDPVHGELLKSLVEIINKKHEENNAKIEKEKIKKLEEKTQKELETLKKLKEKYESK